MNLKTIIYNNNLLYLSALRNNFDLVNNLIEKGFPKSSYDLTRHHKKSATTKELKDVIISHHRATTLLIEEMINYVSSENMLQYYLKLIVHHNRARHLLKEANSLCIQSFFQGNLKAFELFCEVFGKETLCSQTSLLKYIHHARKNKQFSQKTKTELSKYIELLGLNWSEASTSLVNWANLNRSEADFLYFYRKRKKGLRLEKNKQNILRKELINCVESFLKYSYDLNQSLNDKALDLLANRSEFKSVNPYEGYFIILRKASKINSYLGQDKYILEKYLYDLIERYPEIIKYLKRSNLRVSSLNSIVDKIHLKEQLSKKLPSSMNIKTVNKI